MNSTTLLLLFVTECSLNLLPPSTPVALDSLMPFLFFLRRGSTSPSAFVGHCLGGQLLIFGSYPEVAWLPWEMNDLQPSFINVLLPLARLFFPRN